MENQKVVAHPEPPNHQNKKKVSVIKSEILIKYKKINWTPSCKASLLLPGANYKRIKWTPSCKATLLLPGG